MRIYTLTTECKCGRSGCSNGKMVTSLFIPITSTKDFQELTALAAKLKDDPNNEVRDIETNDQNAAMVNAGMIEALGLVDIVHRVETGEVEVTVIDISPDDPNFEKVKWQ